MLSYFVSLVLAKCPMITDKGIQEIGHACRGLKLLHVGKCFQITDAAFTEMYVSLNTKTIHGRILVM